MTRALPWLAVAGLSLVIAGCESTAAKSDRIAESLGPVHEETGLEVDKESSDVTVVSSAVLTDRIGSAVVVRLRNDSDQNLVNVPILIDVRDAKGKTIYTNDLPGIEPALAAMPYIAAHSEADWVNNQVLATGKPDSVKVKVGTGAEGFSGDLPDIEVSSAELGGNPNLGIDASGKATNNTDERQPRLLIYGVARQGDEVVAAGRAAIEHLNAGRTLPYHIFFVGDPTGAELEVTSYPTLTTE